MRFIYTILFSFFFFASSAQTLIETHDFITYDTAFTIAPYNNQFLMRISRPRNMFTPGHPDTASRAAMIHMGGKGETGSNYANLRAYGWHYWYYRTSGGSIDSTSGWDGSALTHGGDIKHYPLLISIQVNKPAGTYDVYGAEANYVLEFLLNTYRIKRNSVHWAGLSMGGFTGVGVLNWSSIAGGNVSTGGEDGMSKLTSVLALQGQSNLSGSGTIGTGSVYVAGEASYQFAGHWAKKYGGKFFGIEGTNDDRKLWRVQQNMNDSVPGSAYFAYVNGPWANHCCWNQMYTPYRTSWKSTGSPLATNITTGGFPPNPNSMGTYREGDNLFTWQFKQGDTSFVGSSTPPLYVVKPALSEYKIGYLGSDSNCYAFTNNAMAKYNLGARKVIDVATGFNTILMLDDQGYVWNSSTFSTTPTRFDLDTTEAAFNNNIKVYGYGIASTYATIRSDSSVWYWGQDHYNLYAGTGAILKPIKLSPVGMKFKKLAMGFYRIVGLTTNGEVWEWLRNGSTTPTQKTVERPAIDIWSGHFDYAGCIIPDTLGNNTMGYPYVWGNTFSQWGGNTGYTQPTSMRSLWGVGSVIKEISGSYNTTHYIDSLGRMFGIGENVQGEIGNGVSYVNRYTYPTPYDWSFNTGENMTGAPPVQIGEGIVWKKIYGDNTLSFYRVAQDENDSLYFWGRDKALVSGRGYLNLQEENFPNVLDVVSPVMVNPLRAVYQQYNFTAGSVNAGTDQNITTTSTTLTATATATTVLANGTVNNGQPDISPTIVSTTWSKESGAGVSILTPGNLSTNVTGLAPGSYSFRFIATDSRGATFSDVVNVTVTNPPAESSNFRLIVPRAAKIKRPY